MPRLVTRSARPINVEILLRFAKLFLLKVMILEGGERRRLGMGVVFGDYGTELMPGLEKGTVGYHTEDRKIFDTLACTGGRKTIGL